METALMSPNDWEQPRIAEFRARFAAATSLAFQRFGFFDSGGQCHAATEALV